MKNKQSPRQFMDAAAVDVVALRKQCAPDEVVMNGKIIKREPNVRYPGDPIVKTNGGADSGHPVFFRGARVRG